MHRVRYTVSVVVRSKSTDIEATCVFYTGDSPRILV